MEITESREKSGPKNKIICSIQRIDRFQRSFECKHVHIRDKHIWFFISILILHEDVMKSKWVGDVELFILPESLRSRL